MHISVVRSISHALTVLIVVASCAFYAAYVVLVMAYDTLASKTENQSIMSSFEWVRLCCGVLVIIQLDVSVRIL